MSDGLATFGGGTRRLFRYVPGQAGYTFTNASANGVPSYVDASGIVHFVNTNVLRDAHFIGGVQCTLLEGARTNDLTQSRDLTNAAWTATTCTVARSTGADGVLNSGSRLTATAGNATVIHSALTHVSAARSGSFWVKRVTGTGNIQITLDNGSTWTTVTVTGSFAQVAKTQTLANSQFGIRIVTNGDAVDVDLTQNEAGAFQSSAIATTAASVTRAADALSFPFLPVPQAMTVYAKLIDLGASLGRGVTFNVAGSLGGATNAFALTTAAASTPQARYYDGSSTVSSSGSLAGPVSGNLAEYRVTLAGTGAVRTFLTINSGTENSDAASSALALVAAWNPQTLTINANQNGTNTGFIGLEEFVIAANIQPLAVMRSL